MSQKPATKNSISREDYERLGRAIESTLIDDYIDLLGNTRRQVWGGFVRGVMTGFGGVIGATVVVGLVIIILHALGGVPVIGQYLQNAGNTIQR